MGGFLAMQVIDPVLMELPQRTAHSLHFSRAQA